jgi:Ca2+-binding RTX toxin-like protein
MIVDGVYQGPVITETSGRISSLEFRQGGGLWLTYLSGPTLLDYAGLAVFHAQGSAAAALIMQSDDQLIGSSHGDHLEGYDGNDRLDGGEGADTLDGGLGNDTYIVDNKDDRIFEAIGGGYDVVYTSAGYAMASDAEIEELRAAAGASSLSVSGSDFSNLIVGTLGNDELDGKGGSDTLFGGAGDDLYIVDTPFDVIWEEIGQGHDTVITSASFELGANIEILKAIGGYSPIALTGNALSNEIFGNLGANEIDGRDGDDWLYGDGDSDIIDGGNGQDVLYGGLATISFPAVMAMTASMETPEKT